MHGDADALKSNNTESATTSTTNQQNNESAQSSSGADQGSTSTIVSPVTGTPAKEQVTATTTQNAQPQLPVNTNTTREITRPDDVAQIHATLNFVNQNNPDQVITTLKLTNDYGPTIYDALGDDVYDYIVKKDYPSYVLLPADEYKAKVNYVSHNGTDYFKDPKLAVTFAQWQKEYQAGEHPLFGYTTTDDDDYTQQDLNSGRQVLKNGETYTIKLKGLNKRATSLNVYRLVRTTPAERDINYVKYLGEGTTEQLAY